MPRFRYKEEKSEIFNKIDRPIIKIEIYSAVLKTWIAIADALADTGADICLLPKYIGLNIIGNITKGKQVELKGIVPFAKLLGFIHTLKLRINGIEFEAPVVIVDSDRAKPIFGRFKALDRFLAKFDKGKEAILEH